MKICFTCRDSGFCEGIVGFAKVWAKYKMHPRLMVTLQDDDFTETYREFVATWKDKSESALD